MRGKTQYLSYIYLCICWFCFVRVNTHERVHTPPTAHMRRSEDNFKLVL